jgi:hypothetical protein
MHYLKTWKLENLKTGVIGPGIRSRDVGGAWGVRDVGYSRNPNATAREGREARREQEVPGLSRSNSIRLPLAVGEVIGGHLHFSILFVSLAPLEQFSSW